MSQYNLKGIFNPRYVEVVDARFLADTIGNALMINLVKSGFAGTVLPLCEPQRQI